MAALGGLLLAMPAQAQQYWIRLESQVQTVAFRGVQPDSVLATDVVIGANGGRFTRGGFAVRCVSGQTYCSFFRPGQRRSGGPLMTTADFSVWGLGVEGLRFKGRSRLGVDLGDSDVWPGTDPAVQLIEGYLEYAKPRVTVQAGRTHVMSRFGYTGFDGAKGTARFLRGAVTTTLYGGWGLAYGVALPVSSPALNPLDEFQPRRRQLVAGGDAAWVLPWMRGRVLYERQVDPQSDAFVSERAGIDMVVRPPHGLTLSGGADYDLTSGWWGSAEATVGWSPVQAPASGRVGARRYRPHFELWTIWGAFNPVPYRALFGSVSVVPWQPIQLRARAETYAFDETETDIALVDVERTGWRVGLGTTFRRNRALGASVDYHIELGPGASSLGFDGRVTWSPIDDLDLTGSVANLKRALEFRFNDADVWQYGAAVEYSATERLRLYGGAFYYDERRDRGDAASFAWNQVRAHAGLRVVLGSPADQGSIHPAILRVPEGGGR